MFAFLRSTADQRGFQGNNPRGVHRCCIQYRPRRVVRQEPADTTVAVVEAPVPSRSDDFATTSGAAHAGSSTTTHLPILRNVHSGSAGGKHDWQHPDRKSLVA